MRTKIKDVFTEIAFLLLGVFIGAAIDGVIPFIICFFIGWIVVSL